MPSAKDEAEKKILGVLSEAMRTGDVYLEVPTSDWKNVTSFDRSLRR
jgi:hypothetical protein